MATATRTRRTAKPAEPEPEESTEEAGEVGGRGPGEMHELFAEFIKDELDIDISAEQVYAVTALRTKFRKTDAYQEYRDENAKRREEAGTKRASRRAAEAEESEPEEGADEPVKPARGRARARKLAAVPTDTETDQKPAAPRRGRGRRAAAAGDDAPF